MLLIIMSLGFEVSTVVVESVNPYTYDFFYIYLYVMALLFLAYCYAFLLETEGSGRPGRVGCLRRSPMETQLEKGKSNGASESPRRTSKLSTSMKKRKSTHSGPGAGSLYLRLGCVVFGVVGLISKGLQIYSVFDNTKLVCIYTSTIVETALAATFIFVQMYFVFENSKLVIHRFKSISSIGFMHLIATNLCMWIRNLVEEQYTILMEYNENLLSDLGHNSSTSAPHHHGHHSSRSLFSILSNSSDPISPELDPDWQWECPSWIGYAHYRYASDSVLSNARSFMTVSIVEYSLICSAIMYVLWRHIGLVPITRSRKRKHRFHVDCSSSTRGLFGGLLLMVFTIITMLIFFTKLRSGDDYQALWIFYTSDACLYLVSVAAIVVAGAKLRRLYYVPGHQELILLDDILLVVGLLGPLVFCIFAIVPLNSGSPIATLLVVTSILRMVEVLLQTLFIFFGQRLSTMNSVELRDSKPGRELIMFLLLTNLSMFLINTLEGEKAGANPFMHEFYGKGIWTVIVHSTTPLSIFFRFHSTVCLAEIWKQAYRSKEGSTAFVFG